jgi:hypothetical protein
MTNGCKSLLFLLFLPWGGCGGKTDPAAKQDTNVMPAISGGPIPTPVGARECGVDGDVLRYATQAEFTTLLIGRWLVCEREGGILEGTDGIGIEITDEMKYFVLHMSATNTVVRGRGFGDDGDIEILDTSSMNGPGVFQVTFHRSSGGTWSVVHPGFHAKPSKMKFENHWHDYATFFRFD